MQDEIAKRRAALDRTSDLGKLLIENSNENPLVVADVQGKLTKVRVQLDRLDARIEQRHAILQNILLQIQVYDVMLNEFATKLGNMEDEVSNFRPISAILEIVSEQREHIKHNIGDNIPRKQPVFEKILEDGNEMLERMEPGAEKEEQQEKLEKMNSRWNDVKNKTSELKRQVEEVYEASQKYDRQAGVFKDWLQKAENKVSKIHPVSCDEMELNASLEELNTISSEIEINKNEFQELSKSSNSLTASCQADGDVIKADFNETSTRWDDLQDAVLKKQATLQDARNAFDKYQSALQPVQEAFTQAEYALVSSEPAGTDADKLKDELEQIKALVSTLDDRKGDIRQLNQSGQQLLQHAEDDAPSTMSVKEQLINTNNKYKDLPLRLHDRQKELEKALEGTVKFNSLLEEIERWVPETVQTVDALEPVSSEQEKLQEQIRETDQLEEEVRRYVVRVSALEETGQHLLEGNMQDPNAVSDIQNKIERARQPVSQLNVKLEQRSQRLQNAMLQSQEFHQAHDDFLARLGSLDGILECQAPVSPDYPTTKHQKEDSDGLSDSVAQMQPVFEKLLEAGEKVLDATDPGEDKVAMQQTLDDLKQKWGTLKGRAVDRENSVAVVIPEAKSFHYGMQAFDSWLTESERKLAQVNFGSVNTEELNQQQKALEDLRETVESHRPDHEALTNMADSLKDKCKGNSYFVEVQIKDVDSRWYQLLKEIESKESALQSAKGNLDEYLDAVGDVEEVLQKAETTLECQEPIDLNTTKRKEELAKVQEVVESLEKSESRQKELQDLGGKLLEEMNPDAVEAAMLKQQLRKIENSFTTTLTIARNRKMQLEKIIVLIFEFSEKYEFLTTWTEEITIIIETMQVKKANHVVMRSQLKEIERIQEDVVKHKYTLQSLDDAGQRLVECCENEPGILMEVSSKVSNTRASFELLSAKVDDQHNKLLAVVLQSQKFQETLDDFAARLGELEGNAANMGPVSSLYDVLRQQSEEVEHASADVKQLEPLFESISKNGQDIMNSLEAGQEKDELEEKLNDLSSRWNEVLSKVEARKAKVDEIAPVSKTHCDSLQSLRPWMTEQENWLTSLELVSCDEKAIAKEQKVLAILLEQLAEHKPEVCT